MQRLINNAGAISEFFGRTGDCGEDATLFVLHPILGLPLTGGELNSLTDEQVHAGLAAANGAEPMSAVAAQLARHGVKYTLYDYQEPFPVDWRGIIRQWSGIKPLIFEFANAGRLPGDEVGVHYHFNTCVGLNEDGTYIFADGDNHAAFSGKLVNYSEDQIANATPCALIVIETPVGWVGADTQPIMLQINQVSYFFTQVDEQHWHCKQTGFTVRDGMLNAFRNAPALGTLGGLTAFGLPLEDEHMPDPVKYPLVAIQRFERATLIYDPKRVYDNPPGATSDVYTGHVDHPAPVQPQVDITAIKNAVAAISSNVAAIEKAAGL